MSEETKEVRYVIRHHPMLFTEVMVEYKDTGKREQIEHRFDWGVSREYCRQSLKERGIDPVIERPEPYVETFPWVKI